MATLYFCDGTTAEVENVRGEDPRSFTIPATAYGTLADAMGKGLTLQFGSSGPVYLLIRMSGQEGTAILQVKR